MEQNTIRTILLAIGALIVLGILWDGLRRNLQRRKRVNKTQLVHDYLDKKTPYISELPEMDVAAELKISDPIPETIDIPLTSFQEVSSELPKIKDDKNEQPAKQSDPFQNEIISITIMAPSNKPFGGYNLLQTILGRDMHYGDMQIFHRYKNGSKEAGTLFNLASATEPGCFDLDNIGKTICTGLVLFMKPVCHENPQLVLDAMLETAQQLADDLDGELIGAIY